MKKVQVSPSLLAADMGNLVEVLRRVDIAGADMIHLDVMDGEFVNNLGIGFPILEAVRRYSRLPMDVHLMLRHPERHIDRLKGLGVGHFSVHLEIDSMNLELLSRFRSDSTTVGLALRPETPIEDSFPFLSEVDRILLVSVNPGFSGQKLQDHVYQRIESVLTEARRQGKKDLKIQVDGGVTVENAPLLQRAGADILVAGGYIFAQSDIEGAIKKLKSI
ncbi:MAG: ribulose-phosphate 3-epimerase [Cytophagales bacterium]|nr:ribulose-phosphate 3-epimerase [Cytophagales bacterium]